MDWLQEETAVEMVVGVDEVALLRCWRASI